jgi:hypothetical protein
MLFSFQLCEIVVHASRECNLLSAGLLDRRSDRSGRNQSLHKFCHLRLPLLSPIKCKGRVRTEYRLNCQSDGDL